MKLPLRSHRRLFGNRRAGSQAAWPRSRRLFVELLEERAVPSSLHRTTLSEPPPAATGPALVSSPQPDQEHHDSGGSQGKGGSQVGSDTRDAERSGPDGGSGSAAGAPGSTALDSGQGSVQSDGSGS